MGAAVSAALSARRANKTVGDEAMPSVFLYPADDEPGKMKLSSHHARSDLCASPAGGGGAWPGGAGGRGKWDGCARGDSEGGAWDGESTRAGYACVGPDDSGPGSTAKSGDSSESGNSGKSGDSGESGESGKSGDSGDSGESGGPGGAGAL
ncbi:hypothetical protein BVG81_004980 [Haliangium sp. UPWRP_2]|nr:hypothetical protein BVG81_004980 [Haliangium sp. UPWRP_2]